MRLSLRVARMPIISQKDSGPLRIFLETFGCQMNILDSELVFGQLKEAGHTFVNSAEDANVVLLNTCSVRDVTEHKVLSRLGKIKDRKDKGEKVVVGVLGCMAERAHDELIKSRPFIDLLVGPSKIHETKALVEQAFLGLGVQKSLSYFVNRKKVVHEESPLDDLELLDRARPLDNRGTPWQAYVRITRGCNKFCSFCVVPRTRGPELHRPAEAIIDEVKRLVEGGALEVTLLGQTINHYYYEENMKRVSFADLLFRIHEEVTDLKRLRFLTSYPRDFTDSALDVMKSCERICKYLHIPAQSGSSKILKTMNRGYDLDTYLSLIHRAKERMPDISLVGDMIVGFPGETEEDFQSSLDLLRYVRYKNVFVFKYSPRPNTTAIKNFPDDIPANIKKERNNIMLELQRNISHELHRELVGRTVQVLCESQAKLDRADASLVTLGKKNPHIVQLMGRTGGDHIVHFSGPSSLIGTLLDVTVTEGRPLSMSGVIV